METGELVKILTQARDAYYNADTPSMSDAEFDEMEEKLRGIDPQNPYFSTVGIISPEESKISHRIPLLSMSKAKSTEEIGVWMDRLAVGENCDYVIEPKIDGLSATCRYAGGKLVYVATRGNGYAGQDISHISEYVSDIHKNIDFTGSEIEIRGELYLPRDTDFETEGRPLRNACAGLINRKDRREDLTHVCFAAFQITGMDSLTSEEEGLTTLSRWGFNAVKYYVASSMEDVDEYYIRYLDSLRDTWTYETDGLIITVNDRSLFEEIDSRWVVDHHHHYAIALKPPSEFRETVLKDILWQVSRQGNIIPVALFDPVVIGGAKLERATLNNYENVKRLKIHRGDTLIVQRANDVIPFVHSNKSGVGRAQESFNRELIVKVCPSCGESLEHRGVHLKCLNKECSEQIIQKIIYWVKSAGIENVAEASIRTLYNLGKIRGIGDLYTLKENDFDGVEGFADKKTENFIREVRDSKTMSAGNFIGRLGIPLVQKKALSKIGINTVEDFINFSDETFVAGKNIIEWKCDPDNMALFDELVRVLDIEESIQGGIREKVCMTGKGPGKRDELIKIIEDMGYEFSSAVTKDLAILICADSSARSSKLDNARKRGVRLMTYDEFFGDKIIDIRES